jgi:hypothetical protein
MWAGDQVAIVEEVRRFLADFHPSAVGNRVLTTILFTDIVGSTDALVRMGDHAWRHLFARHRRSIRSELGGHSREKRRTQPEMGSWRLSKGRPRRLGCARAIIEATTSLGLQVRAGIHTASARFQRGHQRRQLVGHTRSPRPEMRRSVPPAGHVKVLHKFSLRLWAWADRGSSYTPAPDVGRQCPGDWARTFDRQLTGQGCTRRPQCV